MQCGAGVAHPFQASQGAEALDGGVEDGAGIVPGGRLYVMVSTGLPHGARQTIHLRMAAGPEARPGPLTSGLPGAVGRARWARMR